MKGQHAFKHMKPNVNSEGQKRGQEWKTKFYFFILAYPKQIWLSICT